MVKTSADVGSGAEADALDENTMQWIPMKLSLASKSGNIFRGAGRDPIPARCERLVTGRTDEGQSRRIVWEVCPVKCPLPSIAKITKKRTKPSSRTCGCLTCGQRDQLTEWMCRFFRGWAAEDLRRHHCDGDGTGSCKTTVGTS